MDSFASLSGDILQNAQEDYEWHLLINDSIALCLKQLGNYLITAFLYLPLH